MSAMVPKAAAKRFGGKYGGPIGNEYFDKDHFRKKNIADGHLPKEKNVNGVRGRTLFRSLLKALNECYLDEAKAIVGKKGSETRKEIVELLREDKIKALKAARYAKGKCLAIPKQFRLLTGLLEEAGRENLLYRKMGRPPSHNDRPPV